MNMLVKNLIFDGDFKICIYLKLYKMYILWVKYYII